MVQPYSYQSDIIKTLTQELTESGKALMVMASGTGKTITSALIGQRLLTKKERILFLCHNTEILRHAMREYRKVFGQSVPFGIYTGEEKTGRDPRILFASFQTMLMWKEACFRDEFALVVIDESHHGQATTYKEVIEYFTPIYLLGMTATPDRMDGKDIRELFGDERVALTLPEAIAKEYVTPVVYKLMTVGSLSRKALHKLAREVFEQGRRLTPKQLNETIFIESRDEEIVQAIMEHDGQGIVFCESILHAENFAKHLPGSRPYHSDLGKKACREALYAFRQGSIRFLLTVDMFNEGIDVPDAGLVIFLRSTNSKTIFLQQLGRGLRKAKIKPFVTVLDFVANVERLEYVKQMLDEVQVHSSVPLERTPLYFDGAGLTFDITEEIIDILEVLDRINTPLYETLEEASAAARALGIRISTEYLRNGRYKEDSRLPGSPAVFYSDWVSWQDFLGTKKYPTLAEASRAVRALGIKNSTEYNRRYKEDPRLPSTPNVFYPEYWKGWKDFLGTGKYPTLKQASNAARALGIKNSTEYKRRYKEDPLLPSAPNVFYSDWVSWPDFLGTEVVALYSTLAEASKAARALGIKTSIEYNRRHKEDSRLPSSPHQFYSDHWKGLSEFLGIGFKKYSTLEQASAAARALGIKTWKEYNRRYREDPRLPSSPYKFYSDWVSWQDFLGTEVVALYSTLAEASNAARALGIKTWKEYGRRYKEDPRLPSAPNRSYSDHWKGSSDFLGTEVVALYSTLAEASNAARALGTGTAKEYLKRYKEDPRLPSTPNVFYSDWVSWPHFLGKE